MAYTDVSLVASELNGLVIDGSSTPSSSIVDTWISQAADEINHRTGKYWESSTVTSTFDANGSRYFSFPQAPVISVSSLEYEENGLGADSESWVSLTEGRTEDFVLFINEGEIMFTGKRHIPPAGVKNLRVTYTYGYATIPPRIQYLATIMVAARVIESVINGQASQEGGSITVGNISLTDPSQFSINHLKELKNEIKTLFAELGSASRVYVPKRKYFFRG